MDSSVPPFYSSRGKKPQPRSSIARFALLGPFAHLLKFSGFDLHKSFCGRLDSKRRAFAGLFFFALAIVVFLIRHVASTSYDTDALTYAWSDKMIVGAMTLHAFVSLIALARWTARRLYAKVYGELLEVKAMHSVQLERTDSSSSIIAPSSPLPTRTILIVGGVFSIIYVVCNILSSVKRAVYRMHPVVNATEFGLNATAPDEDTRHFLSPYNLFGIEILISIWMAVCTIVATASYVYMHVAARVELTKFNEDLELACKEKRLTSSIEHFSHRHIALLKLIVLLTSRTNTFASFTTVCVIIAQVCVFFILQASGSPDALGTVSNVMWGICSIALLQLILTPPGTIQVLLDKAASTIAHNEQLIGHPEKLALAQLMVDRNRVTPTRMAFMNAIIINAQTPHVLGLLVPLVVMVLTYARHLHWK